MKSKNSFKKVLAVLALSTVWPALILFSAQREISKPRVVSGATVTLANGTLVSWKDLKKVSFDSPGSVRRMRPVMNFADPRQIVKKNTVADPVVQTSVREPRAVTRGALAVTPPLSSFEGMNQYANGAGWPPDPNGDVGLHYYVQAVNTSIGIYNKSTGALVSATTFDSFFPAAIGGPCDNDNNGDPIVLYDRYNQRWFILGFSWYPSYAGGSFFSMAASKTSDPTGDWWTYCVNADHTLMNDYPKCGVWNNGIYVTANMFQFSGGFQHAKIWALKTPELYNGTLTAQSVIDATPYAFSIMPANARGSNPPTTGTPNYMYSIDADEWGENHSDALYVWKFQVNWSNPSGTVWTGPSMMPVAPYDMIANGVPQKGSSGTLDSLYGRLMFSAVYRRFSNYESVYLSHVAEYNNRRAMRWYEIRLNGGVSSIYQQGTYSPDSQHRWMGSLCADKNGNIAMGYSVSSASMFPSIRYCGRLTTDPLGVMAQGETTLMPGTGAQNDYTRWGDYSSLTIDPVDDETFWYTNEYLAITGTNWRTRIGSFKINNTPPTGGGTLEDAIDNNDLMLSTSSTDGSGDWNPVTDIFFYDKDAAKSGTITDNQDTSMEATVGFKNTKAITFYWKVSSEAGYDWLRFYVDGTLKEQISGETDWALATVIVSEGTHTLTWTYHKDVSIGRGADAGWVDKLVLVDAAPVGDTLALALDNKSLNVTTAGNADWFGQTQTSFYGGNAAQSPTLTHDENAHMETTISGFNMVRFYWKVSSEPNYDHLSFYIDGVLKDRISGAVEWTPKSYTLTTGSHRLKWSYTKDDSVSSDADAGWVDKVEVANGIDAIAQAMDNPGLSFSHNGQMNWEIATTDSFYGGTAVTAPAALNNNQSAIMETVISDVSTVKFYWKVSSESDYDFLQFFLDGTMVDQISGSTPWEQKVVPVSSGSHTLTWVYVKDYGVSGGADTGWVDRIQLEH